MKGELAIYRDLYGEFPSFSDNKFKKFVLNEK